MDETFVVIDFETTGLSGNFDRVIEVGALKVFPEGKVQSFQSLINPGVAISETIHKLTGISQKDLDAAPDMNFVFKQLSSFVGNHPIFAHNSSFDQKFFRAEFRRMGLEMTNRFYCTLTLSRKLFPKLPAYNLEELCRHFRIDQKRAHRALADVEATLGLINKICVHLKGQTGRKNIEFSFFDQLMESPSDQMDKLLTREISMF